MNQIPSEEGNQPSPGESPPLHRQPNEFISRLGFSLPKSPVGSTLVMALLICLAGWGALSLFYHLAIYFVHPDTALWLCVVLGCTATVLLLMRRQHSSKRANELTDVPKEDSGQSRRWTTAKPWLVLLLTLFLGVPLARSMRTDVPIDKTERMIFGIVLVGIYLAFWMIASRIERYFKRTGRNNVKPSSKSNAATWQDDWKSAPWWPIGFVMFALVMPQRGEDNSTRSRQNEIQRVNTSNNGANSWNQKRQATSAYWQSAVTNLHAVRFNPPSGKEPAEKYYDRMCQQLGAFTQAAREASTTDVDPDLVNMVTRHLAIEDQFLQMKQEMDDFMQREGLPSPKDTVDQRMAITQLLLGAAQDDSEILKNLPPGPVRDFLEYGLQFEHKRLEQLREIEVMQAVLQERYNGVRFPLPAISHQ